jgi:hypothetical protein
MQSTLMRLDSIWLLSSLRRFTCLELTVSFTIISLIDDDLFESFKGMTWMTSMAIPGAPSFTSFASDSSGQNVTGVTSNGGMFQSQDFGMTFSSISGAPNSTNYYSSVSVSTDFKYQYAAIKNDYLVGSQDFGVTWETLPTISELGTQVNWNVVETNGNGSMVFAAANGLGGLYWSHNYGVNWAFVADAPRKLIIA